MGNKANIKVFDNPTFINELIQNFELLDQFSFIELRKVFVEVKKDEIVIFSHETNLEKQFLNLKFTNNRQLKNNVKFEPIGTCLLLDTTYRYVYYHWIYDVIPQLSVMSLKRDFSILTLPFKYNFQSESLNYFRPDVKINNKQGIYKIEKLIIPNRTTKGTTPYLCVFKYLRKRISIKNIKGANIYITRKRGLKRRIINEASFINYLKNKGFSIYNLEDLSFQKQKELFETANLIIAPHGSGLTNIVFSSSETTIIEIYGPGCGERCFAKIATALGMNYNPFQINKLSYPNIGIKILCFFFPNLNNYHFKVDIKIFDRYYNDHILKTKQKEHNLNNT